MVHGELTDQIIGAAVEVHRALGPGLLESAYEQCLARELTLREIPFLLQTPLPIEYKGVHLDCGYRADLMADGKVIIELKSVDAPLPIHQAQLLTYMRLARVRVGLLINFNVELLKRGVVRRVL